MSINANDSPQKAAIGFMKFLFWFQSLPQFTVGLAQALSSRVSFDSFAPGLGDGQRHRVALRL